MLVVGRSSEARLTSAHSSLAHTASGITRGLGPQQCADAAGRLRSAPDFDPEQAEQVLDGLIARIAEETGSGPQS
ncbi:hypothetical protein CTZ28_22170 [Streptomyces shenzhenensis]|uniref:Uncharacterized protein n=1 Tax=Streptomyces shenzhenensis TaxID=943815 RepID=A0A3M0I2G1_9ACTN|nr:hypothetical protein CTZ28_22170 [Streptomyces shenzhenensis]